MFDIRICRKKPSGHHSTGSRYKNRGNGFRTGNKYSLGNARSSMKKQHHHHNQLRQSNSMTSLLDIDSQAHKNAPKRSLGLSSAHSVSDLTSASTSSNDSSTSAFNHRSQSSGGFFTSRQRILSNKDSNSIANNSKDSNNVASMDSFSVADTLPVRRRVPKPPPFYFEKDKQNDEEDGNSKALVSIRAYDERRRKSTFDFQPTATNGSGSSKAVRFKFGEEGKLASQDYRARISSPPLAPTSSNSNFILRPRPSSPKKSPAPMPPPPPPPPPPSAVTADASLIMQEREVGEHLVV